MTTQQLDPINVAIAIASIVFGPTLAQEVFQAATTQDTLLFAHAEELNNSLQVLTSPDEIALFALKEGWPESYTSAAV